MIDIVEQLRLWHDSETIDKAANEIEKLRADKAAISQTASDYLHTIEQLRTQLATIELPPPAHDPPVSEWDY
jgi:hypothetical protein